MRYRWFAAVMLVALAALTPTPARAQCPATPDCHDTPWIGPVTSLPIPFTDPNGLPCTMSVTYCYRVRACGVYNDLYISGITINPECMGSLTPQQLLNRAIGAIVGKDPNPWGVTIPDCPETVDNWRIFNAGCWASVPPGGCHGGGGIGGSGEPGGMMTMTPCFEAVQCFTLFKVCRSPSGNIVMTPVNTFGAAQCTGERAGCPCVDLCNPF